jgi:DNA-binding response OmpR family regulator
MLKLKDLELDIESQKVTKAGNAVKLKPKEYALLKLFMSNPSKVFTVQAIGSALWSSQTDTLNMVYSHIKTLRTKLAAIEPVDDLGAESRQYIQQIPGSGYKMDPE